MDYATFFTRFAGSARRRHILSNDPNSADARKRYDKRPFRLPGSSEIPMEFIRLCPWELEYLFAVARRARLGVLETGRFNGGSLFVMACAAPEGVPIHSIDIAPQDDELLKSLLKTHCPDANVNIITGDSQKTRYSSIGEVDILFIDGDHTYDGCMNDTTNWYDKLVAGGHLLFHDSYLGRHGVQDAIIDFAKEHPELEVVRSPFIGASYWQYPTGSIAHFIRRAS